MKNQKRPPSKAEARQLSWYSVGVSIILPIIFAAIVFFAYMGGNAASELMLIVGELPIVIMSATLAISVFLSYGVTQLGYTRFAKKHYNGMKKRKLK